MEDKTATVFTLLCAPANRSFAQRADRVVIAHKSNDKPAHGSEENPVRVPASARSFERPIELTNTCTNQRNRCKQGQCIGNKLHPSARAIYKPLALLGSRRVAVIASSITIEERPIPQDGQLILMGMNYVPEFKLPT